MEELARKIMVHIEALVSFCTTIHKIEFAQFHFSRWQRVMREWTIVSSVTLSLHVIYTNCVHVLQMIIILRTTTTSVTSNLTPGLILTTFILATATSCCKYASVKSMPTQSIEAIHYNLINFNYVIIIKKLYNILINCNEEKWK